MITLIGKDLAKEGFSFVFRGSVEECQSCRFKSTCVDSLEEGRKYKIVEVLDNEQKCPIHDKGIVVPVKVEKDSIKLLTTSKNVFEGSIFHYNSIDCDEECEFKQFCIPEGLINDDKCIVIKNNGKHKGKCKKGYNLLSIKLAFVI